MQDFFAFIPRLIVALTQRLYPAQQVDSLSVPFNHTEPVNAPVSPATPSTAPISNVTVTTSTSPNPASGALLWDTPRNAYHSTRVLCDEMGLTVEQKNTLCACIYQESRFNNHAIGRNKDKNGNTLSSDWGIVQVNDYYNIGTGKPFPSVEYVLANSEKMVRWMIKCYQSGQLHLWSSYSTSAYKRWLLPNSPMWKLASAT